MQNPFRFMIDRFRTIRFRFRIISVLVYVVIVSLLTAILLLMSTDFFQRVLLNSLIKSADENLQKSIEMLDIKLQSIHQVSYGLTHNDGLRMLLEQIVLSEPTSDEVQKDLRNNLLNYCRVSDYIYSVNVFRDHYNLAGNRFYFDRLEHSIGFGLTDARLLEQFKADQTIPQYHYKDSITFSPFRNDFLEIDTVSTLETIWDTDEQQRLGEVNINIRADYLFLHLNRIDDRYNGWTYVVDGKGKILFTSAGSSETEPDLSPFLGKIIRKRLGYVREIVHGADSYAVFRPVGTIDWIIVDIIPYHEIMSDYEGVRNQIILISLLLTALFTIIFAVASTLFVKPVHDIERSLIRMQGGDLKVIAKPSYLSEVDRLSSNFNAMVQTINLLLDDVQQANQREREAELTALQSQINPHFLYNTLDIIYWTTDQDEIATISHQLGKFFRLTLNRGRKVIRVQDEVDQVKVYLNIQMIRFKEKFTYEFQIEPAMLERPVMNLILQPIVENALLHGLKYTQSGGLIRVTGVLLDQDMVFEVSDNGTGVDLDRIREILTGKEAVSGYGIRNVHERIQLKFGPEYGLSYRNLETGGTAVTIRMPDRGIDLEEPTAPEITQGEADV